MKRFQRIFNTALMLWMTLNPNLANAKTIYVEKVNNTGIENGSRENPYTSIQDAVYHVEPNDVVQVGAGVFSENVELKAGTPFTIRGAGPDKTSVRGYDRSAFQSSVFKADHASTITLENFLITRGWVGVWIKESNNITVKDNLIIGNGSLNVSIWGSSNCTVDGNTIDGDSLYGNTETGIDIADRGKLIPSHNTTVTNNIVVNHYGIGITLPRWADRPSTDTLNTLISFNNVWNNYIDIDTRFNTAHTLISNLSEDPGFRNRLSTNYELIDDSTTTTPMTSLQGTKSPCIDAGTSDKFNPDGITDLGCYNKYGRRKEETRTAAGQEWQKYE